MINQQQYKLLSSKLRQPVHISYISEHILKLSLEETKKILNELVKKSEIEEIEISKGYYVIKGK